MVTDKNFEKTKSKGFDIPQDAVKGDFNGDGVYEYMWLEAKELKVKDEMIDYDESYDCYIKFSDPKIPPIKVDGCNGGKPENLGDLNKNGSDEIGLLPDWISSCWCSYYVWTLKNGKWLDAVEPISCDQWLTGIPPIEIDKKREGYVIIRYSEYTDYGIITQTKFVKILK